MSRKSRRNYVKSSTDITECICPRCNIKHTMQIFWTGRGIPRKFCPTCKDYADDMKNINESMRVYLPQKSVMETEAIKWL